MVYAIFLKKDKLKTAVLEKPISMLVSDSVDVLYQDNGDAEQVFLNFPVSGLMSVQYLEKDQKFYKHYFQLLKIILLNVS